MNNYSVLISVYYREEAEYLVQSLNSIVNQTLAPNEIVLVEDGPLSQQLYGVIDKYGKQYEKIIKRIQLKKNFGLGRALNEGLKHCSNELVARMDTDDICFPDRFEKQVGFMTEHPEIDVCSSWIEEFEGDIINVKSLKQVPATHEEIAKYLIHRNPLNHPAVMFRKSAVESVGGYQHFPLFEDWYLWARMFVNGARFANIPEPLLHFRTSPQMFKRRGGIKYTMDSARFQWTLHMLGLNSAIGAIKASVMRGAVYLMPNKLRAAIYSKFLRS